MIRAADELQSGSPKTFAEVRVVQLSSQHGWPAKIDRLAGGGSARREEGAVSDELRSRPRRTRQGQGNEAHDAAIEDKVAVIQFGRWYDEPIRRRWNDRGKHESAARS